MQPIYYCHRCAAIRQEMSRPQPSDLIGTEYQLGKYIKHTVPDGKYNVQSVFNSCPSPKPHPTRSGVPRSVNPSTGPRPRA
jgi:hypothetical protein